ncbi:hypothetical protein P9112_014387 [Eukaryota sp. TZLM1-RC]
MEPPLSFQGSSLPYILADNDTIYSISANHLIANSSQVLYTTSNGPISCFAQCPSSPVIALAEFSTSITIHIISLSAKPLLLHSFTLPSSSSEVSAMTFTLSGDTLAILTSRPSPVLYLYSHDAELLTTHPLPAALPSDPYSGTFGSMMTNQEFDLPNPNPNTIGGIENQSFVNSYWTTFIPNSMQFNPLDETLLLLATASSVRVFKRLGRLLMPLTVNFPKVEGVYVSAVSWFNHSIIVAMDNGDVYKVVNDGQFHITLIDNLSILVDGEFVTGIVSFKNSAICSSNIGRVIQFDISENSVVGLSEFLTVNQLCRLVVTPDYSSLVLSGSRGLVKRFLLNKAQNNDFVDLELLSDELSLMPLQDVSNCHLFEKVSVLEFFDSLNLCSSLSLVNKNFTNEIFNLSISEPIVCSASHPNFQSNILILVGISGTIYTVLVLESELVLVSHIRMTVKKPVKIILNQSFSHGILQTFDELIFFSFSESNFVSFVGKFCINSVISHINLFNSKAFISFENKQFIIIDVPTSTPPALATCHDVTTAADVSLFQESQLNSIKFSTDDVIRSLIVFTCDDYKYSVICGTNSGIFLYELPVKLTRELEISPIKTIELTQSFVTRFDLHDDVLLCHHVDGFLTVYNVSTLTRLSQSKTIDLIDGCFGNFSFNDNYIAHLCGNTLIKYPVNFNLTTVSNSIFINNFNRVDFPENPFILSDFLTDICAKNYEILLQKAEISKTKARQELHEFRNRYNTLLAENRNAEEMDQIPEQEFIIDSEHLEEVKKKGNAELIQLTEELENRVLKNQFLFERIKMTFFDCFEVKFDKITSFPPSEDVVLNFPLKKDFLTVDSELLEKRKSENLDSNNFLKRLWNTEAPSADLLYNQSDLIDQSPSCDKKLRIRCQLNILKDVFIYEVLKFNKYFDSIRSDKRNMVSKLVTCLSRLEELSHDSGLGFSDLLSSTDQNFVMSLTTEALTVHDANEYVSEISSSTAKSSKSKNSTSLISEEILRKYKRGLDLMMDGVLDKPKNQLTTVEEFSKPEFVDNAPHEEWTTEMQKEYDEYITKLKEAEAESQRLVKSMQMEASRVVTSAREYVDSFNQKMIDLREKKVEIDHVLVDIELLTFTYEKLLSKLNRDSEINNVKLKKNLEKIEQNLPQLQSEKLSLSSLLKNLEEKKEEITTSDRAQASKFKPKEFSEEESQILVKMFKSRPKVDVSQSVHRQLSFRPYDLPVSSFSDPYQIFSEILDSINLEQPPNVSESTWNIFVSNLNRKYYLEFELNEVNESISKTTKFLTDHNHELDYIEKKSNDLNSKISKLENSIMTLTSDLPVLFRLRQGQVELPPQSILMDFSKCILLGVEVIDNYNELISNAGEEVLKMLNLIVKLSKNIRLIKWQIKEAEMKKRDVDDEILDFQLLKVTKKIQALLTHNPASNADINELEGLKKQDLHLEKIHHKNMKELEIKMNKLIKQIKAKSRENNELEGQIEAIKMEVGQLTSLDCDEPVDDSKDSLMKNIRLIRKLKEVVTEKESELNFLKVELERLRQRTFPSFIEEDYNPPDIKPEYLN